MDFARHRVPKDGLPTGAAAATTVNREGEAIRSSEAIGTSEANLRGAPARAARAAAQRGLARAGLVAILAVVVLSVASAWWFLPAWRAALTDPVPAPDVRLTTIRGEAISLAELRGRVVLVEFWATTCAICLRKMPELARMHERMSPRGLSTIAVAMPYDRPDFVLDYASRHPLPFPIALDPMGRIVQALGPVRGTPTLILIDRAGRIVERAEGEVDLAALERRVERALGG